ncbi:GPP34 family phosphoprotein [Streptomyces sp. NBC_00083]|uniref:GOLPH3/VPS74 family protein n=1 Tax=Streptomyces sp. NBC_00083 TaxID=2975647 RepID=UPI0022592B1D|nr:GPP34 family phosphoprotein [Streptomyces sp. NBC_00083]MCX5386692.1 GPP34 family phosphoprotein [Streptomyces sp. NBC_00083]
MTTARDLLIVSMDVPAADRPVEQGDLSLALAGAELLDLAAAEVLDVEDDRIVPGPPRDLDDTLLRAAAAALVRQEPYESVEDWLWRRGRGLRAVYLATLEAEGRLVRQRRRFHPLGTGRTTVADSPDRRRAAERWASGEPVLGALAAAARIQDAAADELARLTSDTVVTVLAAVDEAVTELAGERQRRTIEDAAFDNIWRGQ